MAKVDDARLNALKALFETDDTISQITVWDLLDAIQEAAQDHEHTAAGGPASGTGDAPRADASALQGIPISEAAPTLNQRLAAQGDPLNWTPRGPIACRAYNNAALSIPNNTWTILTFNSEWFDTDTIHSTIAATSRLTAPIAGPYQVTTHFSFAANAVGLRGVRILAGANVIDTMAHAAAAAGATYIEISTLWWAAAAQYFRVQAYQNSGAALDVQYLALVSPEFMLTRAP